MKKVLVTGGLGYIGSHTVVELISAGYQPVIIDNLINSNLEIANQIEKITHIKPEFYNFDLNSQEAVSEFAKNNPDIQNIIHFAALKAVGESIEQPLRYYANNLNTLLTVLKAFEGRDLNFVFSSSCTVYGQPKDLPVSENSPVQKALSPYGNTKQIAEEILEEVCHANPRLNCIALRYFNPVGAHSSALIGELPIGVPQNLVPFITQSAIGKRGPIQVFGSDYNTPDGTAIRDFIHVVDLAKAHVAGIKNMENSSQNAYRVFNIGTGKGFSVLQIIKAFEKSTGVKLDYKLVDRRPGDIEKVWGDVKKAELELGWKAELEIDDMMKSAWEWEKYLKDNPKFQGI